MFNCSYRPFKMVACRSEISKFRLKEIDGGDEPREMDIPYLNNEKPANYLFGSLIHRFLMDYFFNPLSSRVVKVPEPIDRPWRSIRSLRKRNANAGSVCFREGFDYA